MRQYSEILEFLYQQLPMYQRQGKSAIKKDLSNTLALCEMLDQPQKKFKSIHIAGTNGKGSCAHMLASIFQEAGYKTGLYTSPHLKDFRERIKVNGEMIPESDVIEFIGNYKAEFENIKPSFFEWTVALAFQYFAEKEVDIAIIETGLGGRLDSTNVIEPELSIITNIGLDHTDLLGESKEEIAFEKAGIIKNGVPVVVGNSSGVKAVFIKQAQLLQAKILFAENFVLSEQLLSDLNGHYQKENLRTVYVAWLELRKKGYYLSFEELTRGLSSTRKNTNFRGRWEVVSENPKIIMDSAHNKEGLELVLAQLHEQNYQELHIVLGLVKGKKLNEILPLFPTEAKYYFCQAKIPRALDSNLLKNSAAKLGLIGESYASVETALEAAKSAANKEDLIFVGGSTFVLAEVI